MRLSVLTVFDAVHVKWGRTVWTFVHLFATCSVLIPFLFLYFEGLDNLPTNIAPIEYHSTAIVLSA